MTNSSRLLLAGLLLLPIGINAAVFTFSGTQESVNTTARVTTTFSTNSLQVVIDQLEGNPSKIIQGVAAIDFNVLNGQTVLNGSLTSVAGQLITIADNGVFANQAGDPDWVKQNANDFLTTTLVGQIKHVLLGAPGTATTYPQANNSIAGNNGHPAFVREVLTLTYSIAGATTNSTIADVRLVFGTNAQNWKTTTPTTPTLENGVPEPSTFVLFGGALAVVGLVRRRK